MDPKEKHDPAAESERGASTTKPDPAAKHDPAADPAEKGGEPGTEAAPEQQALLHYPPYIERRHDGGYIVWEPSDGIVTRFPVQLAAGQSYLQAGTVLGPGTGGPPAVFSQWTGTGAVGGILFGGRDTTNGQIGGIANTQGPMRVNASELVWGAAITSTQITAGLAALAALPGGGIQAT
jgi:hypothetical protein